MNNETISVTIDNTFTHDFKGLNISIDQRHLNLKISKNKLLINNQYKPINI
jgi:hypothetical protein